MKKNYYLTTTAPYVNAEPHIGFALEIIQADCVARYHRLLGENVFFGFGTDEHGQKIYQKALAQKKNPQVYTDEYAAKFDHLKKALNLSYNSFIRTTDEYHQKAAQELWRKCDHNGYIYKAKYKVKYCIGCELPKTDSELENDKCPLHPNMELEIREEPNYFFAFSKLQQKLLAFYKDNPDFVKPSYRFKEIKNFVKKGLQDFSISRLKAKMPWGVPVPDDDKHVMYVWFDALTFYISALGWPKNLKKFNQWWPVIQFAGKDNLRQQSAMWQAMLMAAGLPNSKQILIHGFITSDGQKMSKSLGNVVSPYALVKKYGTDAVRYYLLKEVPPFADGDFTIKHFEEVYNADLANGIGNLVQRVSKLAEKLNIKNQKSKTQIKNQKYHQLFSVYKFNEALILTWNQIKKLDKIINDQKPWEKKERERTQIVNNLIPKILKISLNISSFLPETAKNIEKIFTAEKIKAPSKALFPRV